MLSSVKIVLSAPTIRVDKHNANENNIDFIKLLEINNNVLVKHPNIKENQLDRYGLHLNHDGTRVLAKNLRLCAQKYWHDKDSLKQTFTLLNRVKKHSKQITNDLNHESNFVHSVEEYDLALNISPIDSETPNNNFQDDMLVLKNLRVSYLNNIIIGHLNINSFRNKFEMLSLSVAQYVDVLMLKLDSTFASTQFLTNGFSIPHRLDRDNKAGGILLYVRDKIIVLALNRYSLSPHIEIIFFWIISEEPKMACMLFL